MGVEEATNGGAGDEGSVADVVAEPAGTDRGEGDGSKTILSETSEGGVVGFSEDGRIDAAGTDGMNDVGGGESIAASDDGVARLAGCLRPALGEERRTSGPVYCPVHTRSAQKTFLRCIHNGVHLEKFN